MAPRVDRVNDLVPRLSALLDDVLVLDAGILLLKQQLDNDNYIQGSISFPAFLFLFIS